jgi:hypothetical protein
MTGCAAITPGYSPYIKRSLAALGDALLTRSIELSQVGGKWKVSVPRLEKYLHGDTTGS